MPQQNTEPRTSPQPQSPKRRYLALIARADDQAGNPEGDLCRKLADKMAEQWPGLLDVDEVQPVELFEFRWKKFHEKELLIRAAKYFGCTPQGWSGRRSSTKVILVVTDRPTRDLIEQAYQSQRDRLWDVLNWAIAGYFHGSMPLPSCDDDGDSDDEDEVDAELLDLALATRRLGQRDAPMRALTDGKPEGSP